jgi:DNA-directed RNA polymerase beta' subunit
MMDLSVQSSPKIQSTPLGNLGDSVFDGDEMNLHMAQDPESEAELRNLAAVPYQIISPSNNAPIIGIYQDSMVGSYQLTRKDVNFTQKEAMNLLMMFPRVNEIKLLGHGEIVTSFNVLSQIMPPYSLKTKNKQFGEGEDSRVSNNVVEIANGEYVRGQMDKGILGAGTKGLIHRCCNDFGNKAASDFIDDLQNIVTEYMKSSAFSVGISDLISNTATNESIVKIISDKKNDVKDLIDEVQIGVFENNSGKTNEEEFETRVNNILNQASSEAGKVGLKSLNEGNRFVTMVNSGSKGSELNISQMISCLGQQNVDGKRIPYGFEHRTLPHFSKYDDSPAARGFVESSYINGLTPQELFFHAMGGRIGLIDTAVKTSKTGYIQRKLIKGLEDLMVSYDMTIRNSKNKVVQFSYGDDSIDTIKVENQELKLVEMSIQEIYEHYNISEEKFKMKAMSSMFLKNTITRFKKQIVETNAKCKQYTDYMITSRDEIVKNVFAFKDEKVVRCPVSFAHIINNVIGQQEINSASLSDLTMLECFTMIEECFAQLSKLYYTAPNQLFKTLFFYYLSPKELLFVKRFNKMALTVLLETITLQYKRAIVAPGEMVGIIAAQSIGEPTTQMSAPFCEHVRCGKINKITKKISMVSGPIGELCDKLIAQNPTRTFNTGHVDSVETLLEDMEDEYFIVGVDEQERTHWNKISHVSRHPVNGDMMKVTTKTGRVVHTTTSHSHLVRENHKVVPIVGADMKEGMRIPVARHIDNAFVRDVIVVGDCSMELDYLFGWFVGAYLAEGNLVKKTGSQDVCGTINITNVSPHFVEQTKQFASRFDRNCRIINKPGEYGPGITTSFSHKPLADFLLLTCNNGSFVKRIPDFAFLAPLEFKAGLLQAYFDGDGNIQCDEKHHFIRVCSRSKQLAKDVALLLNYFDVFATIKENFTRGSIMYNVAISAKYAPIYSEKIGSLLHTEKLMNLVKYVERTDAYAIPEENDKIPGVGALIAKCGKTLALPGQSRTYGRWLKKESIGRSTLEKYIEIFETHENAGAIADELALLKQAVSSHVIWDEIVDIEIYNLDQGEYVYDFTVPGNQTFMTDYGVIVHNTLNTFHFAGVSSKSNVTRGVPRIEEILSLSSEPKNPLLTTYLKRENETEKENAQKIMYMLEHTKLIEVVQSVDICFDPDDLNTLIQEDEETLRQFKEVENILKECAAPVESPHEKSKWIIRMVMDEEVMLEKNITMDDVNFALSNSYGNEISCVYSDYNADKLVFRIRMVNMITNVKNALKRTKVNQLDQSDQIYLLTNFKEQLLNNVVLRGVKGIEKVILRKIKDNVVDQAGTFKKQELWVLDCIGSNLLGVLALDYVDSTRTYSNHIIEMFDTLGIEAARQTIYNELSEVLEFDSSYINSHHLGLLCDRMTYTYKLISIFRHGINNDNTGPIAKASFEETPKMFLNAAQFAELDIMRGISANVMCGQEGFYGTSAFQVMLDLEQMKSLRESKVDLINERDEVDIMFSGLTPDDSEKKNPCSIPNIRINNAVSIKNTDLGDDNDYNPGF